MRQNRLIIDSIYSRFSLLATALLLAACGGGGADAGAGYAGFDRKLTVVVTEASVHERPDALSRKLGSLRFGQEVRVRSRRQLGTPEGWEELELRPDPETVLPGFVRSSALGDAELLEKLRTLQKSVEGIEPQAMGVTTSATFLRLAPGRDAHGIEKLAAGTRFEMFERQATMRDLTPAKSATPAADGEEDDGKDEAETPAPGAAAPKQRKEIWYKVRLPDGRVGYVYTSNLRFEPPQDIDEYTRFRRPVAWQKLRTVDGGPLGRVDEYLVAYATPGVDFGADFNRVELYAWDGQRYGTPFARSNLRGILPIRVTREGKDVYFELRELDPKKPGQLVARRYHFPHPIKEVERTVVEADVGLH